MSELFLQPLLEQKDRLWGIGLALLFLSLAQGLFLLMVKGFINALFSGAGRPSIAVAELLPAKALQWLPTLATMQLSSAWLAIVVPVVILLAGWAKAMAGYLYQLHQQALALYLAKSYREKLFRAIIALPYTEITKRQVGAWMSLIMNDVMLLQTRFTDIMTGLVRDSVATLACFAVLFVVHWPSALVILLISPFIAFGMGRTGKRIARYAEVYQRELAHLAATVLDLRSRFDFIRSQQGEARERQRFHAINMAYFRMIRRSIMVRSAFAPVLEFLGFAVFAGAVYAIGNGYWGNFTPDLMLQFFVALGLLLRPLREMGEQLSRFHETRGTLLNSLAVFEGLAAHGAKVGPLPLAPVARSPLPVTAAAASPSRATRADLHIREIRAGMAGVVRLAAENLELRAGRAVAVIGPSGAGKSTLLKTLAGLVEPLHWQADLSWPAAVSLVSMVSQEPFLFDDSIEANLTYGLPAAQIPSAEALWQALATVNIEREIRALPAGLATRLRAIGSNVSGGQLQRLVIARAMLRDKPLWLLDEATSAVDAKSEKDITLRLIAACHDTGHALMAVTHRLTWLESFDEVWFIEQGRVSLQGPHARLLADARYRSYCLAAAHGEPEGPSAPAEEPR